MTTMGARLSLYPRSLVVYYWALALFLAVMSISGTVALRNLLLVFLLVFSAWLFSKKQLPYRGNAFQLASEATPFIYVWIVYLALFPFWSTDPSVAWTNLRGPWLESMLTWILAIFVAAILGKKGPNLYQLAVISAVPALLHLSLTLLQWLNLLPSEFNQDPSLASLYKSIPYILQGDNINWFGAPFPWGFHGIEPMHGNIGYAASQATILSIACFFEALKKGATQNAFRSIALLAACLFSVLIASSRGAAYFNIIIMVLAVPLYILVIGKQKEKSGQSKSSRKLAVIVAAFLVALIFVAYSFGKIYKTDVRWGSMWDKIELGIQLQDPQDALCNGISSSVKNSIFDRYSEKGSAYPKILIDGLEGQDGGRILLMREGLQLVFDNPWGLDGSRQAYQKIMERKCGHPPVLFFSHAHQAWINLALSIGLAGAAIYALLLISFAVNGIGALASPTWWPWAMSLTLLAFFWILRGMADGVFQDHYLQMQAFFMMYIAVRQKVT